MISLRYKEIIFRPLKYLSLLCLGILSIISLIYIFKRTLDNTGGLDFHSYWYSGQFIRQGINPYRAYFENLTPSVPLHYLDGKVAISLPVAQPDLATIPANTAPMVFLLTTFSFFSWPLAKILWMFCNLILMSIVPCLAILLLPNGKLLPLPLKAAIFLAFIGLYGTRNTIGNGQTSLLVLVLMLVTLLTAEEHWLIAGITLGVALSKYSLSLPILMVILLHRKWRIAATALFVQLIAWLILSLYTRDSPFLILNEYYHLLLFHINLPGIHLANLFPSSSNLLYLFEALLTILVFLAMGYWLWHTKYWHIPSDQAPRKLFIQMHHTTIITLWTILVAYHRAYDTLLAILFFALVIVGLSDPVFWQLSQAQWAAVLGLLALSVVALSLPARGNSLVGLTIPVKYQSVWLAIQGQGTTSVLLLMLACSIWLLYKIRDLA